jgi:hypothetical protein
MTDRDQVQATRGLATRGLATRDWGRQTQGPKAQVDKMLYLDERSLFIYSYVTLCPAWESSCTSVWGFGLRSFARERSCAWLIGMSGDQSGLSGCSIIPFLRRVYAGMRIVLSKPCIKVKRLRRIGMGGMILADGFCGGCHI